MRWLERSGVGDYDLRISRTWLKDRDGAKGNIYNSIAFAFPTRPYLHFVSTHEFRRRPPPRLAARDRSSCATLISDCFSLRHAHPHN